MSNYKCDACGEYYERCECLDEYETATVDGPAFTYGIDLVDDAVDYEDCGPVLNPDGTPTAFTLSMFGLDQGVMCIADCGCAGGQPAATCMFDPMCPPCRAVEMVRPFLQCRPDDD